MRKLTTARADKHPEYYRWSGKPFLLQGTADFHTNQHPGTSKTCTWLYLYKNNVCCLGYTEENIVSSKKHRVFEDTLQIDFGQVCVPLLAPELAPSDFPLEWRHLLASPI